MEVMQKKINLISFIRLILILGVITGCAASRTVVMEPAQSKSKSLVQLPLSARVELKDVTQDYPNPVTPVSIDTESLKKMLVTYLGTRNMFKTILEDSPDSVLSVDVRYEVKAYNFFEYIVNMKASLKSKNGLDLGKFSGKGVVKGGAVRFSADSDREPLNKAMILAIEELCQSMEDNGPLIMVKLGRSVPVALAEKPSGTAEIDTLPTVKVRTNKNAYAIVIGIEQYRQKLPKADYAVADAKTVTEYLIKVMGYPEENIVTLTNENATKSDFEKYFEKWIANNAEKDSTIFIYYSGHGAPNTKTGDAYLVPYDGDPSFIEQTGYPLRKLYESLNKLPAKEIIVALDSCFSGAGGRSVIAKGSRPLVMNLQSNMILSKKVIVLSASSGDQTSSTYDEKGHGLFTYFLLKGIKNENVVKQDGSIAISDLFNYIKPQVERIARKQYNNEQTPQLIGAR